MGRKATGRTTKLIRVPLEHEAAVKQYLQGLDPEKYRGIESGPKEGQIHIGTLIWLCSIDSESLSSIPDFQELLSYAKELDYSFNAKGKDEWEVREWILRCLIGMGRVWDASPVISPDPFIVFQAVSDASLREIFDFLGVQVWAVMQRDLDYCKHLGVGRLAPISRQIYWTNYYIHQIGHETDYFAWAANPESRGICPELDDFFSLIHLIDGPDKSWLWCDRLSFTTTIEKLRKREKPESIPYMPTFFNWYTKGEKAIGHQRILQVCKRLFGIHSVGKERDPSLGGRGSLSVLLGEIILIDPRRYWKLSGMPPKGRAATGRRRSRTGRGAWPELPGGWRGRLG